MYRSLQLKVLVLLGSLLLGACGLAASKSSTPITEKELKAATVEANKTMDTLFRAMLVPQASYDFVGLKVRFIAPDGSNDDNWAEAVDYYDGVFTVRMLDGQTASKNLHPDQIITVPQKRIVDWVIIKKDGTVIGGYTIRLSYEHMSPSEKKQFLQATRYKLK
jgi:uncharacterized protein YegJ (DUF2314 family)